MSSAQIQVVAPQANQFALMRQLLDPKQFKQGVYQAVKRTTNAAKKIFIGIIQEQTFLQDKYAKRVITSKVQGGDLPVGTVTISQELIPLVGYLVSVTPDGGAVAMVSRNMPVIRLRHAFQARLRSEQQTAQGSAGHVGIVSRSRHLSTKGPNAGKGSITPRGFAGRFAIEEEFGPSVLQIIDRQAVTNEALEQLGDRFSKELYSQVDRFIKAIPPDTSEAA